MPTDFLTHGRKIWNVLQMLILTHLLLLFKNSLTQVKNFIPDKVNEILISFNNNMKKYFLTIVILLFSCGLKAQTKTVKQEKPPTQKGMQDMMKEMQSGMDEISEEDKKMMDSMGIKLPNMKSLQKTVSSISNRQLTNAWEEDNRIVPLKDIARINKAKSVTVSNNEMPTYINKTQQAVLSKLSPYAKDNGIEIAKQVKLQNKSLANSAVGLWIAGKPTLALYLMSEAVNEDPSKTNNLNNYAAFLTMCGAEQLALPILNNLNKRHPKNSSILNNITQAWLGLGDIDRAGKYADSTIRIVANHPQANMAKCLIEESKGNIPAAIAAAKKSISKAFSVEKQNKLEKLGYKLKSEDLNWDRPIRQLTL